MCYTSVCLVQYYWLKKQEEKGIERVRYYQETKKTHAHPHKQQQQQQQQIPGTFFIF